MRPQVYGCQKPKVLDEPPREGEREVQADDDVVLVRQRPQMAAEFVAVSATLEANQVTWLIGFGQPDVATRTVRGA